MTDIAALVLVKNDEYWLPFALKAASRHFNKFVIYDVGSTDGTTDIIKNFITENPNKDLFVKFFPHIDPSIQGVFRNSMIADARTEFYFILDADEIYSDESYDQIVHSPEKFVDLEKIYGVVRRIEIVDDLKRAYGTDKFVPHHRIYHRTANFNGPHPGEFPRIKQESTNELYFNDIICYHFHGCERSSKDNEVPKRLERRRKGTYTPGDLSFINVLGKLPILRSPIGNFPINKNLYSLYEM